MHTDLPRTAREFSSWTWPQIEPYMDELAARTLSTHNLPEWLAHWSHVLCLIKETEARLQVAAALDTGNAAAEAHRTAFEEQLCTPALAANQRVQQHLLDSHLTPPPGFEIPFRNIQIEARLFREESLPLLAEEQKLIHEYNRIVGAQNVEWEGQDITLYQLETALQDPDRATREQAWRLGAERRRMDRRAIDEVWAHLVAVRHRMARNAGFPDYRAFRWQQLRRFDYTAADGVRFHHAVETVVSPVVGRIYERYRRQLGVATLRPWDLEADPLGRPPLQPFDSVEELEDKAATILTRIAPGLGEHFDFMRRKRLLDLGNRKNKAPHAWCATYPLVRQAFIFMNAVGWQRDVSMLLHEAGHAFHVFEMAGLPYYHQLDVPAEFLEVASMAIELLAGPYLAADEGGFYSAVDAARARAKQLEDAIIVSWPYIVAMDAFQHWVYTHPDAALDAAACGARWAGIWLRYMPGVDWSGLEPDLQLGWQSIPHFFGWPFSGLEYGLAQLGAVQIWQTALADQAGAVARYREALALGGTASLPDLYRAAGAKLAFDAQTLAHAVASMEQFAAGWTVDRRSA